VGDATFTFDVRSALVMAPRGLRRTTRGTGKGALPLADSSVAMVGTRAVREVAKLVQIQSVSVFH
jgi:hypothetical protein